jgi:hypothetical protein
VMLERYGRYFLTGRGDSGDIGARVRKDSRRCNDIIFLKHF